MMSTVKIIKATQTRPKPNHRAGGMSSDSRNTPIKNCMIGDIYCVNPMKVRGIRRAAAANIRRGTAVTTPASKRATM